MTTVSLRASQTFERLVLDFLTHLELERGLARNTLAAYRVDLAQFGAFLADRRRDALAVERDQLAAFVDELAIGRAGTTPLAAATLHRKIACLRTFYRHLHRSAMIERNPASELTGPRLAKRRPQSLSRRDIHQLLAQPRGTSPAALRDRALLELLYACGIRASEAIALEHSDLNLDTAVLRVDANRPRQRLRAGPKQRAGRDSRLPPPRPPAARQTTRAPARVRQLPRSQAHAPGHLQDRPAPRTYRWAERADQPTHASPRLRDAPARQRRRNQLATRPSARVRVTRGKVASTNCA
jgi:integrase